MNRDDSWQKEGAWKEHQEAWGAYLRAQRKLANLSLRQLADSAKISNPYLSQLERGMHEPSIRVIRSLAQALNVSPEELLERFGWEGQVPAGEDNEEESTEAAIRRDPYLSEAQKQALLGVYRSYRAASEK